MILKVNGGNGVWISINGGDKSFASGSPMGRMDTCSDNKYGTLYGRALWVKIS